MRSTPSSHFTAFLLNLEAGVDYVAAPITPLLAGRAFAEPMSTPLQTPTPLLSSGAPTSLVAVVDDLTIMGYEGRRTMAGVASKRLVL
jgi:hypothetical protein